MFATTRLNQARQRADMGDGEGAAHHLRAAEGATGPGRRVRDLVWNGSPPAPGTAAAALVPARR